MECVLQKFIGIVVIATIIGALAFDQTRTRLVASSPRRPSIVSRHSGGTPRYDLTTTTLHI